MSSATVMADRDALVAEHRSLRQDRGLVDWSGAGVIEVAGPQAIDLLDEVCTRSVAFLVEERTLPALMLDDDGSVVAVVDVICHGERFTLLVWPDQRDAALAHLLQRAAGRGGVTVSDRSAATTVIGVEGPAASHSVDPLVDGGVAHIAYKSFSVAQWAGSDLVVARIGVTAEFGYTLLVDAEHGETLRSRLVESGALPCSREAVDVCRMESRFVSLERDLPGPGATPFEVGLLWMVDMAHEFAGKPALLDRWASGATRLPVCFVAPADRMAGRGDEVLAADQVVGTVTNALWSPGLDQVIGIAHLDADIAVPGLVLDARGRHGGVRITTCSGPFLVPTSVAAARG